MPDNEDVEVHRPGSEDDGENTANRIVAQMQGIMAGFSPNPDPVADKLTSEHVGKAIDNHAKALDLTADDRKDQRALVRYIIGVGAIVVLLLAAGLLFTGNADIVQTLLIFLAGLAAGGFGGFGLGKHGPFN